MSRLPKPSPAKERRRFASLSEQIAIRDVVMANSKPAEDDESIRVWFRGVKLEDLAKKVAPDLGPNHVVNVVRGLGLRISWPSNARSEIPDLQDLQDRVERLETAFIKGGFDL